MINRFKELKLHLVIIIFLSGLFLGINLSGLSRAEEPVHKYLDYFHQVYQTIRLNYVDVPDNKQIFYGAIKGIIGALNDPYSRFLDEKSYSDLKEETTGKFVGIGIEITIRDNEIVVISPIEDTPAMKAGILSGDVIIKVDGAPTKDKELYDIVKMIKGIPHTKVGITIMREGFDDPLEFSVERVPIKIDSIEYGIIDESAGIGFLKVKVFNTDTSKDIEAALNQLNRQGIDKLIMDFRWNPGGLLDQAIKITDLFLEKDQLIVTTKGREGTGDVSEFKSIMDPLYKGDMIVLVNQGSASASEIFSGAIKDNKRGKLLGTKTFGKGSVQKFFTVDNDIGITLTIAKYYTPSGVSIHGKGIMPDYVVNPDEITNEESKTIKAILSDGMLNDFISRNPEYNRENVNKFIQLLKEKNLKISDRSAAFILKKEINRFTKSPLYDLEFDNQLKEAMEIISKMPAKKS